MENKALLIIFCFLLPPLAVYLSSGPGGPFILNIVLTLLGFWIVGVIHALVVTL